MNSNEKFEIGYAFKKSLKFKKGSSLKETWESLNDKHGRPFKNGESWRSFVKNEINRRKKLGISLESDTTTKEQKEEERPSLEEAVENSAPRIPQNESFEIGSDGSYKSEKLLRMSEEEKKDVNYLLKAHGFDVEAWELISARNNMWNVFSDEGGVKQLYSSKIVVKPRVSNMSPETLSKHLEEFSKVYKSPVHKPSNYSVNGKLLEVNIADLHVGKLAWGGETGESYDVKIAKARFMYIINDVITRTKHYKFNKILFVWTNDFFHYDTTTVTTTAGTRQDSDVRWQKLYKLGVEMLIEAIDLLSQYAPVETFYTGSNHDKMTSFYAVSELKAWYRNNKNIKIDDSPLIRKYIEFGNCLIGFGHGDNEKKRVGSLMPIEAREAWGRTLYHEFHAAHFHTEKAVNEENGTIVRYVSSPTGTDAWHYESGYIGAIKKAQIFVWDKTYGLTDILHSIIPEELLGA